VGTTLKRVTVTAPLRKLSVNLRAIVSSLPLLRRAWRILPGPLRIPLLLIGAAVYLWSRVTGRDLPTEQGDASAGQGSGPQDGTRSR
jgi:hypothetical protein